MIRVKEFPDRQFASVIDVQKAIVEHLPHLMDLKKNAIKESDGFGVQYTSEVIHEDFIIKTADSPDASKATHEDTDTEIHRKVVMNTTNLLDSHGDVHISGIWKRTLQHSNKKVHLQEHKRQFDKVISNNAKAYTKNMTWRSLGADFEGETQALIFDSVIKKSRNPLMFEQYKNGWVENHSVGMQYVDYVVCINSEEQWANEYKKNWDKYYPKVVNKDEADVRGYFWAILEAKLLEGSAVLFGSNWVTPTLQDKKGPEQSRLTTDPPKGTQEKQEEFFNYHI